MTLLDDTNLKSLFREPLDADLLKSTYKKFDDECCPFHCNLFALQVRELFRTVIDRITPEVSIKECCWFQDAQGSRSISDRGKVTRRDRYRFAITENISDDAIERHPILYSTEPTRKLVKLSDLRSSSLSQLCAYRLVSTKTNPANDVQYHSAGESKVDCMGERGKTAKSVLSRSDSVC